MPEHQTDPSSLLPPDLGDIRRLGPNYAEALLRAEAEMVRAENARYADELASLECTEEAQQDGKGVTRRRFVVGSAATVTALATAQFVHTQASFAATPTGTLVKVFLAGGADGLSLVAPAGSPVLQQARPDFVLPGQSIALENGYVLNRAFAALQPYLDSGNLGFLHGVSDMRLTRSHFTAQDVAQLGGRPDDVNGQGWLSSLADKLGPGTAFRAVGIGSTLPRSLIGPNNALALNSIASLNINGPQELKAPTVNAIKTLFTGINHPIEGAVKGGLDALTTAVQLAANMPKIENGAVYQGVGGAFREIAALIKGKTNVRIATITMGGWDTHEGQGTNNGYLFNHYQELGNAMRAFFDDLGPVLRQDVTVMFVSEFGRRVAENGGGTDHGTGGVVGVLSGKKVAGKMLGGFPDLTKLVNGDVPEANNMFNVFGSIAQGRFDLTTAQVQAMFPRNTYTPIKIYA